MYRWRFALQKQSGLDKRTVGLLGIPAVLVLNLDIQVLFPLYEEISMDDDILNDLAEIQALRDDVKKREEAVRDRCIERCRQLIELANLTADDIFGKPGSRKGRGPSERKTCSQFGRKPKWFKKLQEEGKEIPIRK